MHWHTWTWHGKVSIGGVPLPHVWAPGRRKASSKRLHGSGKRRERLETGLDDLLEAVSNPT